jgi:hypothetical protein
LSCFSNREEDSPLDLYTIPQEGIVNKKCQLRWKCRSFVDSGAADSAGQGGVIAAESGAESAAGPEKPH